MDWFFIAVLGAIIGSFLNVVVYRYPKMLMNEWKNECRSLLEVPTEKQDTFNLWLPRSHCPACKSTLPFYCNIPLLSYLFLKGQCFHCKNPIPSRYFMIELASVYLSLFVFALFGPSFQTAAFLMLTWLLIALAVIDLEHYLLPDALIYCGLWLGLWCSTRGLFVLPADAIIGAITGYLFLWILAKLYQLVRRKEGMGYGDCKMLALFGAWVGPFSLLNVILIASILALIVSLILMALKKLSFEKPIPFGPFLAIGGWVTIALGLKITLW